MSDKLSDILLNLYKIVTEDNKATHETIKQRFLQLKVNKPLIHNSDYHGKIVSNDHILDIDEAPFDLS